MKFGLRLLGVPARDTADGTYELPAGQATHLASALALRGDWVARDELASLFWPDVAAPRGRHNLAQLVYSVRHTAWGQDVETDPSRVRWSVPTDVAAFRDAAATGAWQAAAELYTAHLLTGVPDPSSEPLAAWLRGEQDELRETWRVVLLHLADELAVAEQWTSSAQLLRRLLADDGLLEDAVHGLIRAEARSGRREAALRVYDEFRDRLVGELGLEPLETTAAIAAAVRDGTLTVQTTSHVEALATDGAEPEAPASADAPDVRPGPVRGIGADPSPFVGRSLELSELHVLARRDEQRVITLHGPGGTGKSRLARQFARERAGHHEGGAAWVQLASASSEADVVELVAGSLGMKVEPDAASLTKALADRDVLIVLDQAEHLPDLPGLVQDLLDSSPSLRVVATSRAPLDLPDEAVVSLGGMSVPPRDDVEDAEAYDAVGLLLRAGRRTRPGLQPQGEERNALVALARLLGGSPLGLELAAGWLRVLEPSELLEEVRRDLGVLEAGDASTDEAHPSLRAVFESSWSLLQAAEREAVRRLAVFRGGFTRDTAVAVADVPLTTLLALANRSLLHRDDGARFGMHPVVQHFAEGKLAQQPGPAVELEGRHMQYFLGLAQDSDRLMSTPEQPTAIARIGSEVPNLYAALERAVSGEKVDEAQQLFLAISRFWRWRGRAREGLAWLGRVKGITEEREPTVSTVRLALSEGLMLESMGRYDEAGAVLNDALEQAERLGDRMLLATGRRDLAILAWRRGDLAKARVLLDEACVTYRESGREPALAGALGNLGNVARDAGDLPAAHAYFDEALEIVERAGHVWEIANVRNNKAIAYAYSRDLESARREFETALELQRSIDNKPGVSMSLTNLGVVSMDTGDAARAEELYREALSLCEETGDALGVAHAHQNLGAIALEAGDLDGARDRFADALRIRRDLGARAMVAQSVAGFIGLAVARGAYERALVLAGAAESIIDDVGVPLSPPQQATHDEDVAGAKAHVEAPRADELVRRGAALSEQEAVEYALGTRALP